MSSTITSRLDQYPEDPEDGSAGVSRSEPGGRAAATRWRCASPGPPPDRVKELLPDELIDELMVGARTGEEITGQSGLLAQLTKRMVERAMEVELTDHLGYEPHTELPGGAQNTRTGSTPKRLLIDHGEVQINTPRDRDGSFEPKIVRKRQQRFEGFDDKTLALSARGMSTRDISAHLEEIYGVQVGRDLIARSPMPSWRTARAWQARPLQDVYPVVFLDALVLKIRDGATVVREACHLAIAIGLDGDREVLGLRFLGHQGREVLDAGPDRAQSPRRSGHPHRLCRRAQSVPRGDRSNLPGHDSPDLHRAPHPGALKYVPRKQYDHVVKDLKPIYTALNADEAMHALERLRQSGMSWRSSGGWTKAMLACKIQFGDRLPN